MELCKKVQVESEYDIHVLVGSTNFYTCLQFSLLASTWFPRPLGVCLWSLLHIFLVLYEALMLLIFPPIIFALAVLLDAYMVAIFICAMLTLPLGFILYFVLQGIVIAVVWLWLVITCQCCTMPGRAPGQGLGHYGRTAGGSLQPQDPQPAPAGEGGAVDADEPVPAVEGRAAATNGPCAFLHELCRGSFTMKFVSHVILVSFPYWRAQLTDLCREIAPWCNTIVI